MLPIGVVHAAVRDDRLAVRLGYVADADDCGDAADPGDVGLHYVNEALPCREREWVYGVPVLSGGEYLMGDALAHLDVAVEVIRRQVVFQPLDAIRLQRF